MEDWREDFVTVNGLRLHYIRTGAGDKPVLLLLHGLTDSGRYWSRTARALEDLFDVVMLDQRGHGLSDAAPSGYSDEEMAADAAAVIEALNLAPVAALGHSMGGAVTNVLAGTRPELVSRALLLDPALNQSGQTNEPPAAGERGDWYQRNVAAKKLTVDELAQSCQAEHPNWDAEDCRLWAEANIQVRSEPIRQFYVRRPWQETLPLIECPALLIYGDQALGSIISSELAEQIKSLAPNVQQARIADAGHSIQRDQFDAYIAVVRDFLIKTNA